MKKILYFILLTVFSVSLFILVGCEINSEIEMPSVWNNESAYAYATELGYEGTLEEFIAQISGVDGIGIDDISLNEDDELVIKLTDDTEINLGSVKGDKGLSAYEIYKKYNPEYTGTEEQWLDELINGKEDDTQGFEYYLLDDNTYAVSIGYNKYLSNVEFP